MWEKNDITRKVYNEYFIVQKNLKAKNAKPQIACETSFMWEKMTLPEVSFECF